MHFRLLAKHDVDREKRGILLSIVLRHVRSLKYSSIDEILNFFTKGRYTCDGRRCRPGILRVSIHFQCNNFATELGVTSRHTVVPTNFRIAATARYIGADHA